MLYRRSSGVSASLEKRSHVSSEYMPRAMFPRAFEMIGFTFPFTLMLIHEYKICLDTLTVVLTTYPVHFVKCPFLPRIPFRLARLLCCVANCYALLASCGIVPYISFVWRTFNVIYCSFSLVIISRTILC